MDSYLALHWERLLGQLREAAEAASRAREAGQSPEGAVQQSLVDTLNRVRRHLPGHRPATRPRRWCSCHC